MTARSDMRAGDTDFRDQAPRFRVGDRVRSVHGVGVIEFVAHSNAMKSPLYTVAIDSRIKVRLIERAIAPESP
jgi:hypothetical protein